jgi:hypothetical protein
MKCANFIEHSQLVDQYYVTYNIIELLMGSKILNIHILVRVESQKLSGLRQYLPIVESNRINRER